MSLERGGGRREDGCLKFRINRASLLIKLVGCLLQVVSCELLSEVLETGRSTRPLSSN